MRDKTDKLNNVNRDLDILKSAYNSKLEIFNAVKEKDKEVVNFLNHHASIILKASILEQVLYDAARICRELPDAEAMAEDTFIDDRNYLRWEDVLNTGLHVFIAGLNGAASVDCIFKRMVFVHIRIQSGNKISVFIYVTIIVRINKEI